MQITLSFFDLLIIVGMVTGIICSLLLFKKSDQKIANRFLGLGILAFVWLNTKTLLLSLHLWEIHGFGFFPNGVELALPPLFYFYLVALVNPNFKFAGKQWLHFLPFLLSQTYAIIVYVAIMQTPLLPEKELIARSFYFNEVKHAEEYLTFLSTMIYLYFGYRRIQNYRHWLQSNTADTRFSELGFMRNLVYCFLIISTYTIVNLILNRFLDAPYLWRWQLSHLSIAALVYYMGLVGYKNADLIPPEVSTKSQKSTKKTEEPVDPNIIVQLRDAIEKDKVHLNPKLSLRDLAKALNVNESILSNAINTHYQKNFRSFINSLRVEEVKHRLLHEGLDQLSLLGLAKECGFNSEASFYRIFKAETGSTPKQFLAAHSSDPPIQKI